MLTPSGQKLGFLLVIEGKDSRIPILAFCAAPVKMKEFAATIGRIYGVAERISILAPGSGPPPAVAAGDNWRDTLPETNLPGHGQPRAG